MSITAKEASESLCVCLSTIYDLFKHGHLRGYRVGRKVLIDPQSVEDLKTRGANQKYIPKPKPYMAPPKPRKKSMFKMAGRLDGGFDLP